LILSSWAFARVTSCAGSVRCSLPHTTNGKRSRRQSFCLGGALLTTRDEEKIFEHFIVAGYPQEAEEELLQQTAPASKNDAPVLPSMPPQILFQYPCTTLSNPQVSADSYVFHSFW